MAIAGDCCLAPCASHSIQKKSYAACVPNGRNCRPIVNKVAVALVAELTACQDYFIAALDRCTGLRTPCSAYNSWCTRSSLLEVELVLLDASGVLFLSLLLPQAAES
jgi:hypothetical protein